MNDRLAWFHGPTSKDPDPGKMWCLDCGREIFTFDGVLICSGCEREDSLDDYLN